MVLLPSQGMRVSVGSSALRRVGVLARRSRWTVMLSVVVMMVPGVSRKRRWMVSGVMVA